MKDMKELKLLLYDEENCESYEFPNYVQRAFCKVTESYLALDKLKDLYYECRESDFKCSSDEELYSELLEHIFISEFVRVENEIKGYQELL